MSEKVRKSSAVWDLGFEKTGDGFATCTRCNPPKDFAYHGGTTNLRNHLQDVHKVSVNQADDSKIKKGAGGIASFFKPAKLAPARAASCDDKIVEFVCRDLRPIAVVTGAGFRSLINFLEPAYRVPSATQVTKLIQRKHDVGLKLLSEKLTPVRAVALTTDLWTSRRTEGYITVTVHFISDSWQLQSGVLTTCKFSERHTAENIAAKLNSEIARFGLQDKVTAIVHDQAANMKKALRLLGDSTESEVVSSSVDGGNDSSSSESEPEPDFDAESEADEGEQTAAASAMRIESLECAGHRLQCSLQAGLKLPAIKTLLTASRKIVGHFNHSTASCDALRRKQQGNNKSPKQLIQDCATRWDSAFLMLERLIELRWFVSAVLAEGKAQGGAQAKSLPADLKPAQWELASQLLEALKPFKAATTFLSAQLTVSVSCVLPVIFGLKAKLQPDRKDKETVRVFKQKCRVDLTTRWSLESIDFNSVLALSCAVDPRFKNLPFLSEADAALVRQCLVNKVTLELEELDTAAEPPAKRAKPDNSSALDYLFGPEVPCTSSCSSNTSSDEVTRFVSEPLAPRTADPLDWWRVNSPRYPNLSTVASSLLCVPGTSTPAERIFSAAGNIITKKRACLLSSNADALIFLNRNWNLLFTKSSTSVSQEMSEVTAAEVEAAENPVLPQLPQLQVSE